MEKKLIQNTVAAKRLVNYRNFYTFWGVLRITPSQPFTIHKQTIVYLLWYQVDYKLVITLNTTTMKLIKYFDFKKFDNFRRDHFVSTSTFLTHAQVEYPSVFFIFYRIKDEWYEKWQFTNCWIASVHQVRWYRQQVPRQVPRSSLATLRWSKQSSLVLE